MLVEELLVYSEAVLVCVYDNCELRVVEVAIGGLHYVMKKLSFDFTIIILRIDLERLGLLNKNLKHAARLLESVEDPVSNLVV